MKLNKKILVPALALAAFTAVGVGSTYAIFTSEAKINIAVTSGKVAIEATIENFKLYSGVYNETTASYDSVEQTGSFLNGGTATIEEDVITLDKITPMDKVEFDLKIANKSNIVAKYRTEIKKLSDTGLFAGLNITIDDEEFAAGDSDWTVVQPTTTEIATMHIAIELPEEAENEYQDKACSIQFGVAAVQGNAHTENSVSVKNQTELVSAVHEVEEGTQIILEPSETPYAVPSISNKNVTIVGEDAENTMVEHSNAVGVGGSSLTFKNVTMVGGNQDYKGFQHVEEETYENCIFTGKSFFYAPKTTVKNCTFIQDVYDYHFWVYGKGTTKFEGCTFNNLGKAAKIYSETTNAADVFNVEFKDCTFNSSQNTHNKPAIAINSLGATYNVKVTNCTATGYNCNDDAMETWYSTRMAGATNAEKCLVGSEGQLDMVTVTINGKTY